MELAETLQDTRRLARAIRAHSVQMVHAAGASHIGACLSVADLLAVMYGDVLRVDPSRPDWPGRDRFILSKGHAAAVLYAVLAERGFFPVDRLQTYCDDGSDLAGHSAHAVPGVEFSTGSLGHGLPVGSGMALASKRGGMDWRVFVLLGDGELDEGSNWEAILFAAHHGLDNLIAIIDRNRLQAYGSTGEVCDLEPLGAKLEAFRWAVVEGDGHDVAQMRDVISRVPLQPGKPTAIIAHTVKGKGVGFMEDSLKWHYKSPDVVQVEQALEEIGTDGCEPAS